MKDMRDLGKSPSRREFLGGLAALGAGAFVTNGRAAAQTPPRIVSVHHHLVAPAYARFLTENKVREFPHRSIAEGIEDMDEAGVTTAISSTIGPGVWSGNLPETRRLAREVNEYAATVASDHPGRFGMFTMLPLPDIDGSLKEIEYGLDTLNADGVFMYTNWGGKALYGDKYLGDSALAPVYEELQRRKAVVYVHPKDAACCVDIIPGLPDQEYPMDTARTMLSVLHSGTAGRYPDVRFIFAHAGGALPYMIGRLDGPVAAYLQDGGTLRAGAPAPRITPALPRGVLYELQRFCYDTSSAVNPIGLGGLRKMVPLSQILFGGDFPFADTREQRHLLEASGVFTARELRAVYSENIGRLLPRYMA